MKNLISKIIQTPFTSPAIFWGLSMAANLANWLFNVIAGRTMASDQFSVLMVFISFQYLISVPAFALTSTVGRFTAYYGETKEREKHFYFFRQFWWLSWTLGLISLAVFIVFQNPIGAFFGLSSQNLVIIFSLMLLPFFLLSFEKGALFGQMAVIWVGVIYLIEAGTKLTVLLFAPNLPFDLLDMAVASLPVSVFAAWLISILITRSSNPLKLSQGGELHPHIKETYEFLGNSIFAGLGVILLYNLDILLVKHFFSPSQAGIYSTLSVMGKTLYFGAGSLIALLIPLTARAKAAGESGRKPFLIILGLIAAVGFAIWLSYLLIPQFTVNLLLGENSAGIFEYLATYTLGMLFLVLSNCFITYSLAGKNYLPAYLTILAAIVQTIIIAFYHSSLGQVVNIVTLTMFTLLLVITVVEFLEISVSDIINNLTSLLKLVSPDAKQQVVPNGKARILVFNWRDTKHVLSGGSEIYLEELGLRLIKRKYQVTIFTSNDGKCSQHEVHDGLEIIRRGGFITVYFWAAIYYIFRFQGKYDLILDSENGIPFFTPLYSQKPVILLVHHVHQDIFFQLLIPPFSWIANFLESYLMPWIYRNSKIIAVSPSTAKDLQKEIGMENVSVIENGVDLTKYQPGKKAPYPLITYVGRLKKYKSIEVLLTAFKKVLANHPRVKLIIAGDGDYRQVLEKAAVEMGIKADIVFTGKISEEEKVGLLARSWLLVQPSYKEGWGITCLEANACQTPVLASNVAGLKDAVSEGTSGYLFEFGDSDGLARRITELINRGDLRQSLSLSSRKWAGQFSWDKQADKFYGVIENTISAKSVRDFSKNTATVIPSGPVRVRPNLPL